MNKAAELTNGVLRLNNYLSVPETRRGSANINSLSYTRRGSAALSATEVKDEVSDFSRVMVLYTGGTIGMVRNEQGGKLSTTILS